MTTCGALSEAVHRFSEQSVVSLLGSNKFLFCFRERMIFFFGKTSGCCTPLCHVLEDCAFSGLMQMFSENMQELR